MDKEKDKVVVTNDKYILLERGKHFTRTSLATYLQSIFGNKKSGEPYSAVDCQKYIDRNHLPLHLGGFRLTEIRDDQLGLKMIKIEDDIHEKFNKK